MTQEDYKEITIDQIRNLILTFKNDDVSHRLDKYYNTKSYSEIIGVSRKELVHSNFIAWLLSSSENHNLVSYPLEKFLEILVIASNEYQGNQHKDLFDAIITGDFTLSGIQVETEHAL
ncbi:MAG: PD-(D/E)XK nuclease family protein [Fibrobacterales bacterium]